jgi:hypothetical protein
MILLVLARACSSCLLNGTSYKLAPAKESTDHWLELLLERNKINQETFDEYKAISKDLQIKLNNFIKHTKDENEHKI